MTSPWPGALGFSVLPMMTGGPMSGIRTTHPVGRVMVDCTPHWALPDQLP